MSTLEVLRRGIGDKVQFEARPNTPLPKRYPGLTEFPLPERFTLEIVGLDDNAVYLAPWASKLSVFTRVQNTETGAIDARKIRRVGEDNHWEIVPLTENERLVTALNRKFDGFSVPEDESK